MNKFFDFVSFPKELVEMEYFLWLIILFFVSLTVYAIISSIYRKIKTAKEKERIQSKIHELVNNTLEMSPDEFFDMRQESLRYGINKLYEGVYILFNKTKNMYYVGQSKNCINRVNNHFTGKGNGDVYADFKYGDEFTIKMIALALSGYESLNALERHTIATYDAFASGYNKTRGNW